MEPGKRDSWGGNEGNAFSDKVLQERAPDPRLTTVCTSQSGRFGSRSSWEREAPAEGRYSASHQYLFIRSPISCGGCARACWHYICQSPRVRDKILAGLPPMTFQLCPVSGETMTGSAGYGKSTTPVAKDAPPTPDRLCRRGPGFPIGLRWCTLLWPSRGGGMASWPRSSRKRRSTSDGHPARIAFSGGPRAK